MMLAGYLNDFIRSVRYLHLKFLTKSLAAVKALLLQPVRSYLIQREFCFGAGFSIF